MELHSHQSHARKTRPFVDLEQFMGDWYVIANIPTPFELNSMNAVESFHWNETEKRIDVDYHFNEGGVDGPVKHYPQKAWIANDKTNAEWKVQFVWPLKLPYRILEVAPDYSWALVGTSQKGFVWMLARKPHIDVQTYQMLCEKLARYNYDISRLRKVPQIWDPVS